MAGSALFTAVTGLQSFQRKLDVIASNIANVNTTGYRGARVLFQDLFSQTLAGGNGPSGVLGSTNGQQIGLGVSIASIDSDHSQGALTATGVSSDLAIQGDGFFILSNRDGDIKSFTRVGSFSIDTAGFLVDPATGLYVQGYSANNNGVVNADTSVGPLSIPIGGGSIVQATTLTQLVGNLSADAVSEDLLVVPPVAATVVNRTLRVYDSLGTPRDIEVQFTKIDQLTAGIPPGPHNAWSYTASFDGTDVSNVGAGNLGAVVFDSDGNFVDVGEYDPADVTVPKVFSPLGAGIPNISVPLALFTGASIPSTALEFNIGFGLVTERSAVSSELTNPTQDGFPLGVLQDYVIGNNGLISGVFSNGLTRVLGQVALSTFSNLGGLERIGNNQFRETSSSGNALIGTSDSGGRGSISGGALESSNVDLGSEFSNMIVTQRAFQANARTITTADNMMQETVNLVR